MAAITLQLTEIDKLIDALVGKQFTGGVIKIIETDHEVTIRDCNDMFIASWKRQLDDERHG